MPNTVLQKLRAIDLRLAEKVSRNKIGSLVGRVYFQQAGSTTWSEVPLVRFTDQGVSSRNSRIGSQVQGHRFAAEVGRDWWDTVRTLRGNYAVRPTGIASDPLIQCDLEGHVADDSKTTVSLELIAAFEITV